MSFFRNLGNALYDGIIVLLVFVFIAVVVTLCVDDSISCPPHSADPVGAVCAAAEPSTAGNCHLCGRAEHVRVYTAEQPVSVALCTNCVACLHFKGSPEFEVEEPKADDTFLRDPALYPTEKERVANKLPPLPVAVKAIVARVKAPVKVKK